MRGGREVVDSFTGGREVKVMELDWGNGKGESRVLGYWVTSERRSGMNQTSPIHSPHDFRVKLLRSLSECEFGCDWQTY